MADEEITLLPELTTPVGVDLLAIVDDPAGTPVTKRLTLENLLFRGVEDITDGSTVVGQARVIAANDVAGAAVTIIANGTRDVTTILAAMVVVKTSDGNCDGGPIYVKNNDSWVLYTDGTDTLTLAVAADGSATLQRTAGSTLTFDVVLNAIWI